MNCPRSSIYCLGLFILSVWIIVVLVSARRFSGVSEGLVNLGFGGEVFTLHLNRFRYRIRWFPVFALIVSPLRHTYIIPMLVSVTGVVVAIGFLIGAGLFASSGSVAAGGKVWMGSTKVVEVEADGVGAQAGFETGMILEQVNGVTFVSGSELITHRQRSAGEITIDALAGANSQILTLDGADDGDPTPLGMTWETQYQSAVGRDAGFIWAGLDIIWAGARFAAQQWWSRPDAGCDIPVQGFELACPQSSNASLSLMGAAMAILALPYMGVLMLFQYHAQRAFVWLVTILTIVCWGTMILGIALGALILLLPRDETSQNGQFLAAVLIGFVIHVQFSILAMFTGMSFELAGWLHVPIQWSF